LLRSLRSLRADRALELADLYESCGILLGLA
jgi:hypothetical protein